MSHVVRAGVVVLWLALLAAPGPAWAGQEEQFTPEFRELRSSFDPKHTPKISAPDSVQRGVPAASAATQEEGPRIARMARIKATGRMNAPT